MKELVSGTKLPTSCGSGIIGVDVALIGSGVAVELELVGGAVEVEFDIGGLVLVPLFDCASAPIPVQDQRANSSSRIKPFLEVNKLVLSNLNTHNLFVMC